jgi:hypothetical protein
MVATHDTRYGAVVRHTVPLYVKIDELLKAAPQLAPWRPVVGIVPKLSDAELVTLAVMQALLGRTSEARWLGHADHHLRHLFPYLPGQRSDLAGWASYGWCASHSRWFWGLRLHLVCTLHGLPILFALTGAKAVDREVPAELLAVEPDLVAARPGQLLIADKNYYGREFEGGLAALGVRLLRPARKAEPEPAGVGLFKPLRQLIESVNDTFKGQLDLEQHGGHTPGGVWVRVLQRILALTAAIWHNHTTGQPTLRSLVAYDH